ncbi:MFS transporter [uncultured Litoreibacter sp.]|uniref:MFS transporter n=1 Tax=uncultured Litoreibacter sp. TaxID=1392394 RepID=UPI0026394CD8|nr:MFS transporter [uncultured Litoreibacter sp.]
MSVLSAIRISHAPVAAFAAVGLCWGAFAALAPQLKTQLGADDATFGLLLLGTSIGLMTTMFFAPWLDRRLGQWAMPVGAVLLATAFLFPGLITSPWLFFCAMAFAGMASGMLDVIMNARVSELETAHGRPLMNANHGMFSVAYAIGAFGTGLGREAQLPPVAIFAITAAILLLLTTRMRMQVAAPDDTEETPARFPYAIVLICGAVVMIAFMAEAAVEAWSALHVERTLGGRAAEGALGPTMLGLTMAVGRLSGQAVSEKFSDLTVIFWAACLAATGAVVVATAPTPLVAYVGFGTIGLGVSVIGPLGLALVGRLVPARVRTTAISRAAVIGFVGFFLAPAVMGLISQGFGLRVAFGCVALLVGVLFPLLVVLRRRGG